MTDNTAPEMIVDPEVYPIAIDYDQSLEEMIAAGHYECISPNIVPENFPMNGVGKIYLETFLGHYDLPKVPTNVVLAGLESLGFRPATLAELLAFGIKYPNEQKIRPINALGSSCPRPYYGLCICGLVMQGGPAYNTTPKRKLSLDCLDGLWGSMAHFLIVRK